MEDPARYLGGSGPPIVLLHSGFSCWAEWRALIELLTPGRTVLAPTLPGGAGGPPADLHGGSLLNAHADHVERLLDDAGWQEPVSVVGSSFGGVCALELAARGRASRVLALAPPFLDLAGSAFYAALFSSVLPTLRLSDRLRLPGAGSPRALTLLLHGSAAAGPVTAGDAGAIWHSFARFPFFRTGIGSAVRGRVGPGMPRDLARISIPVTFAWGGADRLVPGWMHEQWRRAVPHATVVQLDGLPHVPHLRDPGRIAGLIEAAARR